MYICICVYIYVYVYVNFHTRTHLFIKSFHFAQTSGAKNSGENNTGKNKNKKGFNCFYWFLIFLCFTFFLEFCSLPGVSPGRLSPASPRERPVLETSIKNLIFPRLSPGTPALPGVSPGEKLGGKRIISLFLFIYSFFCVRHFFGANSTPPHRAIRQRLKNGHQSGHQGTATFCT